MARLLLALGALLALAACAADSRPPKPAHVQLTQEKLRVRLSDGRICQVEQWKYTPMGEMAECGMSYRVISERNSNPVRSLLDDFFGGKFIAPRAEVTLRDTAGVDYRFSMPQKPN